jgi:hypothetical protein
MICGDPMTSDFVERIANPLVNAATDKYSPQSFTHGLAIRATRSRRQTSTI